MFLRAKEIQELLKVSKSMSYKIIRNLNDELTEKGYLTLQGRVPLEYLCDRFMLDEEEVKKTLGGVS